MRARKSAPIISLMPTSQDEFGGPEVLKCFGDPRLVSPRVPNPRERPRVGSNRPPQQTTVHSLREKAQLEVLRHEARALQPATVDVAREGKDW